MKHQLKINESAKPQRIFVREVAPLGPVREMKPEPKPSLREALAEADRRWYAKQAQLEPERRTTDAWGRPLSKSEGKTDAWGSPRD